MYLAYPLHERLGGSATQGVTKPAFLAWWLGKGVIAASQVGQAAGCCWAGMARLWLWSYQ